MGPLALQENCQQLELSDLDKLPPDQWFTIFMIPVVFTSTGNASDLYQAKIDWTTKWLERREEKDDFDVSTETKHFHNLPIHFAFNVLSNNQLQIWLDQMKQAKAEIGENEEDAILTKETLSFLSKDHQMVIKSDLELKQKTTTGETRKLLQKHET